MCHEPSTEPAASKWASIPPELRKRLDDIREELASLREAVDGESENSPLLTREEAAERLRISVRTLDDMAEAGEIQPVRIRGRVLYHRDTLEAFVRRHCRGDDR